MSISYVDDEFQITPIASDYTLADHVAKLREQQLLPQPTREYIPTRDIPANRCPGELLHEDTRARRMTKKPCKGEQMDNGWCSDHQRNLDILHLGARIGFPRMQINPHMWVGEGKGQWEELAVVVTSVNLVRWLQLARSLEAKKELQTV